MKIRGHGQHDREKQRSKCFISSSNEPKSHKSHLQYINFKLYLGIRAREDWIGSFDEEIFKMGPETAGYAIVVLPHYLFIDHVDTYRDI